MVVAINVIHKRSGAVIGECFGRVATTTIGPPRLFGKFQPLSIATARL